MHNPRWLIVLTLSAALCARLSAQEAETGRAALGREMLYALQDAVKEAKRKIGPALVHLHVSAAGMGGQMVQTPFGMARTRGTDPNMTGIIISKNGHVLIPMFFEKDKVERLEAWLGDKECRAKFVAGDKQLQMSILKLETDQEFSPIDIYGLGSADVGNWVVSVFTLGKEREFATFTTLGMIGGTAPSGAEVQFNATNINVQKTGAPVVDLEGRLVGLIRNNSVLAVESVRDALEKFVEQTTGEKKKKKDDDEKGQPFIGIIAAAINEQYAEAVGLPKSGIWVKHVLDDSPAKEAGLMPQDLIVAVDGKAIERTGGNAMKFYTSLLKPEIGREIGLKILRNGEEMEFRTKFVKRDEDKTYQADDVGISVKNLTGTDYYGKSLFTTEGVLVTEIKRGSPAGSSVRYGSTAIMQNDVILEFMGQEVKTVDDLRNAIERVRAEKPDFVLVKLLRGRMTEFSVLNMKIGEKAGDGSKGDSK